MSELRKALEELAECDFNAGNCASLEVANKRIRALARNALAAHSPAAPADEQKPVAAIDRRGNPTHWLKHFDQEPWSTRFRPCYLHPAHPPAQDTQPVYRMKDHEIRELVNLLTEIGQTFGQTQQLRARIHNVLLPILKSAPAPQDTQDAKGASRYDFVCRHGVALFENGHVARVGRNELTTYIDKHIAAKP